MQISYIEKQDPALFEELSMKKKWSNVSKDPTRALKDQQLNQSYWNQLNHLPKKGVNNIVTSYILQQDKKSCDTILNKIYEDKKMDDQKKEI